MAVFLDLVGLSIGVTVLCEETRERVFLVALSDTSVVTVVGLVGASHDGRGMENLEGLEAGQKAIAVPIG